MHATPTPGRSSATPPSVLTMFEHAARCAQTAGVFGGVEVREGMLWAAARDAAEAAHYRLEWEEGRVWVSLVTPARYLSQSIEADLMFTGDKLEDLIDEELGALGCEAGPLEVQHFRSADRLFTFRSPLPAEGGGAGDLDLAVKCLLAYEAAFRDLGDMSGGDEE